MAKNKIKIPTAFDQLPDAKGPIMVTLPILPPSTNALFRNVPGKGRVKTGAYRVWTQQMGQLLIAQCRERMPAPVSVAIFLEDKTPRADCDNKIKAVLDLLVQVGILKDDSAAILRSVSATWTPEIEGLKIQVWPWPWVGAAPK